MKSLNHLRQKALLLLLLVAAGVVKGQTSQPYKSNAIPYHGYAYPIVPGTEAWKNL